MLIKYIGADNSPLSFIEELQRSVTAGEVVNVKNTVGARLLASGRWRKQIARAEPKSVTDKTATPSRAPKTKQSLRKPARTAPPKSTPPDNSENNLQSSTSEVTP